MDGQWQVFERRRYGTGPTHGKASTYQTYGCRCQPCRDANTAKQLRENAERRERLIADPSVVEQRRQSPTRRR